MHYIHQWEEALQWNSNYYPRVQTLKYDILHQIPSRAGGIVGNIEMSDCRRSTNVIRLLEDSGSYNTLKFSMLQQNVQYSVVSPSLCQETMVVISISHKYFEWRSGTVQHSNADSIMQHTELEQRKGYTISDSTFILRTKQFTGTKLECASSRSRCLNYIHPSHFQASFKPTTLNSMGQLVVLNIIVYDSSI